MLYKVLLPPPPPHQKMNNDNIALKSKIKNCFFTMAILHMDQSITLLDILKQLINY